MKIKVRIVVTAEPINEVIKTEPTLWYSRVIETSNVSELALLGEELGAVLGRYELSETP